MPSTLEALLRRLRRLRQALGGPRSGAPLRDGHPYRVPGQRSEPDSWRPEAGTTSDLAALIQAQCAPLMAPRGDVETERLDPPGLLHDWRVIGARRWFWQYQCCCAIVFENDGRHFAYVPKRTDDEGAECIDRLPARTWAPRAPPEEVDLAPVFLRALRRAGNAGASQRVLDGIALLHLLATFTGHGSAELTPPRVLVGHEAIALLGERLGRSARADVRDELVRSLVAPDEPRAVLVDRTQHLDGTSGGYHAELALARLRLGRERIAYTWEILWSASEEGTELS